MSLSADYILKKNSPLFSSEFQIAHLENLSSEAIDGYIEDQIKSKKMAFSTNDVSVQIIDSCTFCKIDSVKVKMTDGNGAGWVLKQSLKKVKTKKK